MWTEETPFEPMLAQQKTTSIDKEKNPVIAQPKLDGVRAIYDPRWKQLFTRNGMQIECCDHIIEAIKVAGLELYPLDGEIYLHGLHFDEINQRLIADKTTDETRQLEYHIFDWINWQPMLERLHRMRRWNLQAPLKLVDSRMLLTQAGIQKYYDYCLRMGYEGAMLRTPSARYKIEGGRSRSLRKLKAIKDTEATIIGFTKGTGKNTKTFGSLLLRLPNGIEFKCAGFDDQTRQKLHQQQPIGTTVTFVHQGFTDNGVPRFPRYKGIRIDVIPASPNTTNTDVTHRVNNNLINDFSALLIDTIFKRNIDLQVNSFIVQHRCTEDRPPQLIEIIIMGYQPLNHGSKQFVSRAVPGFPGKDCNVRQSE